MLEKQYNSPAKQIGSGLLSIQNQPTDSKMRIQENQD